VQGIFIGAVAAFVVFITIIGPEYDYSYSIALSVCLPCYRKHGSDFEHPAFEKGGGREESLTSPKHVIGLNTDKDIELEKVGIKQIE
jgi:SHS family lactate transporter-like MFS transporter